MTSAKIKDKADLDNIYVPMKLTIIKSDEYEDMVPNIAKFANSQNKVTDADLFQIIHFILDLKNYLKAIQHLLKKVRYIIPTGITKDLEVNTKMKCLNY